MVLELIAYSKSLDQMIVHPVGSEAAENGASLASSATPVSLKPIISSARSFGSRSATHDIEKPINPPYFYASYSIGDDDCFYKWRLGWRDA